MNQGNTRNNGEIMIPMRRGFDSSTCIFDENVLVPAPLFTAQICIVITSHPVKLFNFLIQVNFCQKLLFLHQLTHNMTTDCSLNYKFNTWKFQAQNMGRTCCVQKLILTFRTIYVHNMFSPCSAKIKASDKGLPVHSKQPYHKIIFFHKMVKGSF